MATLEELQTQVEGLMAMMQKLLTPTTKEEPHAIAAQPSGPTADGKNPCGCGQCAPHRVLHWWCSVCGGGPYKFSKDDSGKMAALRPYFVRGLQKYLDDGHGGGRWHYGARYCCSQSCTQRELRIQNASLVDTAQRRPDLADAIAAQLEAGGVGGLAAADPDIPDLGTPGLDRGGALTAGGDDLE